MLFFNSQALLYLKKDKLELFVGNKKATLNFPDTLTQNIEILDSAAFAALVSEFLLTLGLKKKKILVVLSEEIFFQTVIPAKEDEQLEVVVSQFISSVPFDPLKIAFKKIRQGDQIRLIAANKDFFRIFQNNEESGRVYAVVPVSIFKEQLEIEDDLDAGLAKKILSKKELIQAGNLLSEEEIVSKSRLWQNLLYIFLLLLTVGLSVLAFAAFTKSDLRRFKQQKGEEVVKTTPSESSPSASEEESSASAKESRDITIQIFNGSGIAGQAGALKDQLNNLGYENTEVGNAVGAKANETIVVFSKSVSFKDREQIMEKLKSIFESVGEQEESENNEFDVIITTGNPA